MGLKQWSSWYGCAHINNTHFLRTSPTPYKFTQGFLGSPRKVTYMMTASTCPLLSSPTEHFLFITYYSPKTWSHPVLPDPTITMGHWHICLFTSYSFSHSRGKLGSLSGSHLCVTTPLSVSRRSWRTSGTRGLERKSHLRARKLGEQSFVYDKKDRLTSYLNSNVILNCSTRLNMPKFFTQNDFLNQILLILVSFRPPTKYLRKHNTYQNFKKNSIHMLFPQDP